MNKFYSALCWFLMCLIPIFAVAFYNEGPIWIQNRGGEIALVFSSCLIMFGLLVLAVFFDELK